MIAENIRLSRRRFLLMALASLTAACSDSDRNTDLEPVWLAHIIGDPEACARLGRAYLDAHPEYYGGDTLVADIQQALAKHDAPAAFTSDPQRTVTALQLLVRDEYIRGEVEVITGWILSITEARLYALAALR